MVAIDGRDVPDEVLLQHLGGHDGSRPVRLGNAARHQLQHDIVGPLLDAASLYEQSGGTLQLPLWRQIRGLVSEAVGNAEEPDHGIWEPRSEPTHNVHSKLMNWVALDRAVHIAPRFGGDREFDEWTRARSRIMLEVLERGYDAGSGTFVGSYGGSQVDATLLLLPIYRFLPPTDERVQRTNPAGDRRALGRPLPAPLPLRRRHRRRRGRLRAVRVLAGRGAGPLATAGRGAGGLPQPPVRGQPPGAALGGGRPEHGRPPSATRPRPSAISA